jgi:hypothetical protein
LVWAMDVHPEIPPEVQAAIDAIPKTGPVMF